MIRAFLIFATWFIFMVLNLHNYLNLLIGWAIFPFAGLLACAILEKSYAGIRNNTRG